MPEGEAQPRDVKTQVKEAWEKLKRTLSGKSQSSPNEPRVKVFPPNRVRVSRVTVLPEDTSSPPQETYISPIENTSAARKFIDEIRRPDRYRPYSAERVSSSELGLMMDPRNGFFEPAYVLMSAMDRYKLPLAMYISGSGEASHARLVVGSPRPDPSRGVIRVPVYDPISGNITEVEHPQSTPLNSNLLPNALAESDLASGTYDITYFNDPNLSRFKDSFLIQGKFAPLQRDSQNCVPYSLFVGAMLQALKPGDTPFKREGIPQFQKDFGVQILTRENITGVRISA